MLPANRWIFSSRARLAIREPVIPSRGSRAASRSASGPIQLKVSGRPTRVAPARAASRTRLVATSRLWALSGPVFSCRAAMRCMARRYFVERQTGSRRPGSSRRLNLLKVASAGAGVLQRPPSVPQSAESRVGPCPLFLFLGPERPVPSSSPVMSKAPVKQTVEHKVRELAEPLIAGEDLELLDVEYLRDPGGWILRLTI